MKTFCTKQSDVLCTVSIPQAEEYWLEVKIYQVRQDKFCSLCKNTLVQLLKRLEFLHTAFPP